MAAIALPNRPMSAAMADQLTAPVKALALFMEADFRSGTVRMWTGYGNRDWNGQTWLGSGGLVELQTVPETVDVMAQQIVVIVSGIDPAMLALVLEEGGHNLRGKLWLAFLDETGAVIADPILLHAGLLDQCQIVERADGPVIQLVYQNQLADLERPRLLNYTDADQQRLFPGDRGFEFVAKVQEWNGVWGGG